MSAPCTIQTISHPPRPLTQQEQRGKAAERSSRPSSSHSVNPSRPPVLTKRHRVTPKSDMQTMATGHRRGCSYFQSDNGHKTPGTIRPNKTKNEVASATPAEPAAAADQAAVLVGQAFALLKNDLCRGTSRSFSLPLRSQYFRVGALQVWWAAAAADYSNRLFECRSA